MPKAPVKQPKRPTVSLTHLSKVGKWVMVTITSVAAIIGLLANARNLGLAPWLKTGGISLADLSARRVTIVPGADTLRSIGDTLHLAATVTDERGATVSGTTIVWATDDSTVAAVDSAGGVVARGAGAATISATVREHRAFSRISVWQRVRSVAIAHDTLVRLAEGSSMPLVARALDGRGHPVRGRELTWSSADTTVVAVSAGGYARAVGPGRTTLTVAAEGYTAVLAAEVMLTPASLQVVTGEKQHGPAGRKLPVPVQVQVISHSGKAVPGALVNFGVEMGEGAAAPESSYTDKSGRARSLWTLGPSAGPQVMDIIVKGLDSVLVVSAEADPVARNTRIELVHEIAPAAAGARRPDTTRIRVTDSTGAAVDNVPVAWTALDGGSVEPLMTRTNIGGEAWARWTFGPRAGKQHVRVQVGNPRTMPAFTISAVAGADSAAQLSLVSGDGQKGRVGAVLEKSVVVRVTDRSGNPVPGAAVFVTATSGAVADSAPVADSAGRVRIRWTLGRTAGAQQLAITLRGSTVKVTARAAPLGASNIALSALPDSAPAGRALSAPVVATVTDVYGNIVPEALVVFTPGAGAASPARVMSDAKGTASTRWTLGRSAGDQALTATVRGTAVKATVFVRAEKKPGK